MLDACPHPWILRWFNWYCRYALRKHFHRIHVEGELPTQITGGRLYVVNHSNFWDGIVLNLLLRPLGQPLYCMIEVTQVKKHPFFRRIGGFSINRSNPRDAVRSLEYAAKLIKSGAAVVIFPQGKLEHADKRPLIFERGVAKLLEQAETATVIPISLLYEFGQEQRPEIPIRLGSCHMAGEFTVAGGMGRLQDLVTRLLDESRTACLNGLFPGRLLLKGRNSISEWRGPWLGE